MTQTSEARSSTGREELVTTLYTRAEGLIRLSYGYLLAIVTLIGFAIWVFYTAAQVTEGDLSHNAKSGQQSLNEQSTALSRSINDVSLIQIRDEQRLKLALAKFLQGRPEVRVGAASGPFVNACCNSRTLKIGEIADQLQKTFDDATADNYGLYTTNFTVAGLSYFFELHKDQIQKFVAELRSVPELFTDKENSDYQTAISRSAAFMEEQRQLFLTETELQRQEAQIAAGKLLGKSGDETAQTADNRLQLIQTSITRFGTITLIVFLVSVFSTLYRYTTKLAVFYRAQADALTLEGLLPKATNLASISMILTPKLDFGKAPPTPVEQISGLLKNVRGSARPDLESE